MSRKHTRLSVQLVLSIMRVDDTIDSTLDKYPYITMQHILDFIAHASYGFFAAQRRRV
jgi:uncharacterized protein (DUF433 family)